MEGGIKSEVFEKLAGDPMMLNIIFEVNKNENKSQSWAFHYVIQCCKW